MAAKKKKRWIQAASKRMKAKGTKGSYGHHSDKQKRADIKKGGAIAKKAQFALNVEKRGGKRGKKKTAKRTRKRTASRR